MLDTLSGTFFWRILLIPRKAPPSASTTSSLGGALRRSHMLCLTQILPFLISMTPFYNRIRCRRGGKITWQHIWIHNGSVFLTSQSRIGLTATLSLGECLSPVSLTLLGTSISQLRVLNIRLFIMLRLWRERIDPEWWVRSSLNRRVQHLVWWWGWKSRYGGKGRWWS